MIFLKQKQASHKNTLGPTCVSPPNILWIQSSDYQPSKVHQISSRDPNTFLTLICFQTRIDAGQEVLPS